MLNSTANTGVVHLIGTSTAGATAIVGSGFLPTLEIGSTLSVEGSGNNVATLDLQGGVLDFFNGGSVYVSQKGESKNTGSVTIKGELNLDGGKHTVTVGQPLTVESIRLTGTDPKMDVHADVTTTSADTSALASAIYIQSGEFQVDSGLTFHLVAGTKISLTGGTFITDATAGGIVTIEGSFSQWGTSHLELGTNGKLGTLLVKEDASLGARATMSADVNTVTGKCDLILCDGKMYFGLATNQPTYTYVVGTAVHANTKFRPFRAKGGIQGTAGLNQPNVPGFTVSVLHPNVGDDEIEITKT